MRASRMFAHYGQGRRASLAPFALGVFLVGALLGGWSVGLAPAQQPPPPVLVGAGDIAYCDRTQDEATAMLLDRILRANPGATVFTAGDNAYPRGTAAEFSNCYEPSWGRFKARTRPSPGNHDYRTEDGAPYYAYFGANAGPAGRGYYSYALGDWHIISLNSNVNSGPGSVQEAWLRRDLAANAKTCTLAYWHHARFSSGYHGNDTRTSALFQALYDHRASVLITGHDHHYERFAPQDPQGEADPAGIRVFVVGTGGAGLRRIGHIQPNSEVRNARTYGVLKLTLHPTRYDWEFIPIAGKTFRDSGSAPCVTGKPRAFHRLPVPGDSARRIHRDGEGLRAAP